MSSEVKKDIKYLLKSSAIVKPLEVIKGFFVLKFLTPEMYGLLNIINQVTSFAKYGDLGFVNVVEREYNFEIKNSKKAEKIKNNGYSAEIILALLLFLLVFSVSFFYIDNEIVFFGIICASFMLLSSKLLRMYRTHLRITKKFELFASFNTLQGVLLNLSVISTVSFLGIYSPLIMGVLVSFIVLFIFFKKINIGLAFSLEKDEIVRQLKIGVSLGGLTFLYGISLYLERYLILDKFGLKSVGYFAFAMFIVLFIQYFIYDIVRPYMPRTKEELSKGNVNIIKYNVFYPTIKIFLISFPLILVSNIGISFLVNIFFPNYIEALDLVFYALLLVIPISIDAFCSYLLYTDYFKKLKVIYILSLGYLFLLYIISYEILILVDFLKVIVSIQLLISLIKNYFIISIIYNKWILFISYVGFYFIFLFFIYFY